MVIVIINNVFVVVDKVLYSQRNRLCVVLGFNFQTIGYRIRVCFWRKRTCSNGKRREKVSMRMAYSSMVNVAPPVMLCGCSEKKTAQFTPTLSQTSSSASTAFFTSSILLLFFISISRLLLAIIHIIRILVEVKPIKQSFVHFKSSFLRHHPIQNSKEIYYVENHLLRNQISRIPVEKRNHLPRSFRFFRY